MIQFNRQIGLLIKILRFCAQAQHAAEHIIVHNIVSANLKSPKVDGVA
ncbi:MAG: hypothetical protein ACOX2E_07145 [Syntrophaceticus sp.]